MDNTTQVKELIQAAYEVAAYLKTGDEDAEYYSQMLVWYAKLAECEDPRPYCGDFVRDH